MAHHPHIGELLLHEGFVEPRALAGGLDQQLVLGGRLGTNLVERAALPLDQLGRMLALQHGVPHAGTAELRATSEGALARLAPGLCLREQILPLEQERGWLHLAMCDPDPQRVAELAARLGTRIVPHVTPELRLLYYLEQYYGLERPSRFLRVPDGGESFSRRRHYLLPTVDPFMAEVLSDARVPLRPDDGRDEELVIVTDEPGPRPVIEPEETVSLSLVTGWSEVPAKEAAPAQGAVTVARAAQRLLAARSRQEVLRWLVSPLAPQTSASLLLSVRGYHAILVQVRSPHEVRLPRPEPVVSLQTPSILELAFRTRQVFRTEGQADRLQLLLAKRLGLPPPGEVCVAPVFFHGRTVYLLCVHSEPGATLWPEATTDLDDLSARATAALERIWRRMLG